MVFAKRLRDGVRSGRIRCSVRIWMHPHVKVGGRYPVDDGHIVVDSIERIRRADITADLAQESGFSSVKDLLETAQHGAGRNMYLVRFHYLPPGAWDVRHSNDGRPDGSTERPRASLLRRIGQSAPPRHARLAKKKQAD